MGENWNPHPTQYWHRLDDGRVQCDVCPRECKLKEGQQGLCFVRACENGQVVLTTYGRSSGFCIDPIEKKPLNHFLPGAPVLSFGTAGCNLTCKFCQNWDMSKSREVDTLASKASPEGIANRAEEYGCRSVAYTYNDPVIFLEYADDAAAACRERGIKNVAVTAGYVSPGARERLFRNMDAANIDLKAFTDGFYHRLCGGHLQNVLDNLIWLRNETDVWIELTTLIIPGENDSPEELDRMSAWVAEHLGPQTPMHFSAFHPDFKMLDYPSTRPETLVLARDLALRNGIRYAYLGNVRHPAGESTWCHHCGGLLIERSGYRIGAWNLTREDDCAHCGTPCAGVFEPEPGHWGARRLPVAMGF